MSGNGILGVVFVVDLDTPRGFRCQIVVSVVCRLQGVVLVVEGDVVNLLGVAI